MIAAVYAFAVLFIAFRGGAAPVIDHADRNLAGRRRISSTAPAHPQAEGEVAGCHSRSSTRRSATRSSSSSSTIYYFGLLIFLWGKFQKRGQVKSTEVAPSHTAARW